MEAIAVARLAVRRDIADISQKYHIRAARPARRTGERGRGGIETDDSKVGEREAIYFTFKQIIILVVPSAHLDRSNKQSPPLSFSFAHSLSRIDVGLALGSSRTTARMYTVLHTKDGMVGRRSRRLALSRLAGSSLAVARDRGRRRRRDADA